ncbi:MAG: ribosome-associated translation inhibitor RaiA [Pirellulales bacterium]|mgnify:FL=1|nr:ribosome-associated translation inhibitor RaiA [Thermoguttaceae bacterium]MDD4789080.1 ribosome-associated translation inhibitor RaiA [Pirellulales bacterium]
MQIRISTRHGDISDATQEKITAKVEKLTRLFDRLSEITVTIDLERRDLPAVDLRVAAEHKHDFVAAAQSEDLMAAVDVVLRKLEQQLRKYKEKIQGRHRNSSGKQEVDVEVEAEAESLE